MVQEPALTWRKSSHSSDNGGNCVEVAAWRKSSHSSGNGGACVEVSAPADNRVLIRDTTDRQGPVLTVPASAWTTFTTSLR